MVRRVQSPAGGGLQVTRKNLWFCLWFIVSGIITDIHCISGISGNNSVFEKSSNYSTSDALKNKSLTKESSNASATLKDASSQIVAKREGRAVPPRVKTPQQDDIDYKEFLNDEVLGYVRKIPMHILELQLMKSKMVPRPGRSDIDEDNEGYVTLSGVQNMYENNKRNTMIPMARYGRQGDADLTFYDDKNPGNSASSNYDENYRMLTTSDGTAKREVSSNNVIPYPRLGRSNEDSRVFGNMITNEKAVNEDKVIDGVNDYNADQGLKIDLMDSNARAKRETRDYVLPQMRYGRSMILLSSSRMDKATTEKPHTFVLPYPRPGRSPKYANVMLPYPRPGRSSKRYVYKEPFSLLVKGKRQGYMLPSARLGRSTMNSRFENNDVMGIDEGFLGLKVNPLFLKTTQEKPKDAGDSSSLFVIPYPRPGKKSMPKMYVTNKNGKSNNMENKNNADYVLPYPRPGKKSYKPTSKEKLNDAKNTKTNVESFIVPYPRPGRDNDIWFETASSEENLGKISDEGSLDLEEEFKDELKNSNTYAQSSYLDVLKKSERDFMIPYARLGRDYTEDSEEDSPNLEPNDIQQFSNEQEYDYDPHLSEIYSTMLEDNGREKDSSISRFKRSNSVVPYPRLGRSNSVVPYPRPGRFTSVVPYPRPGRSNSIVPYPRPGRSNSIVPYPRLGRSNTLVPYPRPGRSNSMVPYPRPGRSNSVVPYPRPGRSNTLVPYPRSGRSDTNSNSEISYSVIPYPRPGKSNSAFPVLRQRSSKSPTMYAKQKLPNDGQSQLPTELNNQRQHFLLPNIRPGRYSGDQDTYILPYPRPGRSTKNGQGYVLPHPRIGRSDNDIFNETETSHSNTVIPYPRLGRSQKLVTALPEAPNSVHKLNKHMLTIDDSIYLLPYPRPGRYTE